VAIKKKNKAKSEGKIKKVLGYIYNHIQQDSQEANQEIFPKN
jgi:hypothetical protein